MSTHDDDARAAMAALIASLTLTEAADSFFIIAELSFDMADAMQIERNKRKRARIQTKEEHPAQC